MVSGCIIASELTFKEVDTMTIQQLIDDLNSMIAQGVAPDTLVIVCDTDFDPDPDVLCDFYCEERDRVCLTIM